MEQPSDRVDEQQEEPGPILGRTQDAWEQYWHKELEAEAKRNRKWRQNAESICKRYTDERADVLGTSPHYVAGTAQFRINLFYSNTFTQQSFLYGRLPEVDVSRRFADPDDDQARAAANILQRLLNTSIETDGGDFSSVLRAGIFDHLVPGLAQGWARYEVATTMVTVPAELDEDGNVVIEEYEKEEIIYEDAPIDYVPWRDFRWGYGRIWRDVPWVGKDIHIEQSEAIRRFGPEIARRLTYESSSLEIEDKNQVNPDQADPAKTSCVTEIWFRDVEGVFWYEAKGKILCDVKPDPLQLPGFFPCPPPFMANATTTLQIPRPYFIMAQDLYNEVDQLSTRINIITNAVKVIGVYDKSTPELKNMLQNSIENDLVPVDQWAMLAEKGGLKGVIDFFPVSDVVEVLVRLREMRTETVDFLYQVTGIADILRGSGQKYEGVGKAQLKARFGSVRIQYLQDEFARWASDLLTLKAQVISRHFEPRSIVEHSNIQRSYDAQLIGPAIQLIKSPQLPWRVEVKPESMAMIDWAQLQSERTEFINALALFLQSAAPLLEFMPQAMPTLLELLKWGMAGFKGSKEIESVIDDAIRQLRQNPPKQGGDDKANAEMVKSRARMQENQQKFRQDMMKQADKARKELEKLVLEFRARLEEIDAETRSDAIGEVVQADQAIREEREKARLRPVKAS